jgi:hypothetical protein
MGRLIFLICVVVLIFDLADDGRLGKVKFVASHHAAKYSVSSPDHNSGQAGSQVGLPPASVREIQPQFKGQPASFGVVQCYKINDFCFIGGSGGIPL